MPNQIKLQLKHPMKAILEFDLPEEEHEHQYALAGLDALLVIDDILNEIRSALKYDGGELAKYTDDNGAVCDTCGYTLEAVREYIINRRDERNLPELI